MKYWKRLTTFVRDSFTAISTSGHSMDLSHTSSSSSVFVDNSKHGPQPHRIVVTRTVYKVTKKGHLKKLLCQTFMSISDGPTPWPEYPHRKEVRWQAIFRKYKHRNSLLIHNSHSTVETTIMPENQVPSALVNKCHNILKTFKPI